MSSGRLKADGNFVRGPGGGRGRKSAQSVLAESDFTYVGSFRLPRLIEGAEAYLGYGLAHRYVNGQLRFFSTRAAGNGTSSDLTGSRGSVYEVPAPATRSTDVTNLPLATGVQIWGRLGAHADELTQNVLGIFWDEVDQKIYCSTAKGDLYDGSTNSTMLSACTLNDTDGTYYQLGTYRVGDADGDTRPGYKALCNGSLAIPQSFADTYCNGRRIAVGFGSYHSVMNSGPISAGPCMVAIETPPDAGGARAVELSTNRTTLVYHRYSNGQTPYTNPLRGPRADVDYWVDPNNDGQWDPLNGQGYYGLADVGWQTCVWVDSPTKRGVVWFHRLGNGRQWYEGSDVQTERGSYWVTIYDPLTAFAPVALGQAATYSPMPSTQFQIQLPFRTYDSNGQFAGWSNQGPGTIIRGVTYDSVTQSLYVAVQNPTGATLTGLVVHEYQLG